MINRTAISVLTTLPPASITALSAESGTADTALSSAHPKPLTAVGARASSCIESNKSGGVSSSRRVNAHLLKTISHLRPQPVDRPIRVEPVEGHQVHAGLDVVPVPRPGRQPLRQIAPDAMPHENETLVPAERRAKRGARDRTGGRIEVLAAAISRKRALSARADKDMRTWKLRRTMVMKSRTRVASVRESERHGGQTWSLASPPNPHLPRKSRNARLCSSCPRNVPASASPDSLTFRDSRAWHA